ncbi:YdeI/OmpD-associated family protein [Taibaiella koreensis]|uniref:YdeI/OmpD-associated family protein n=1 Tax=Taibaiella koreensis TaxID=1268548 RepID=UPI000E59FE2C|nr:YdeI/OmpD-associated family protein [Taibaiella koreensis]
MAAINITEIVYPKTRKAWRQWLQQHYKEKKEVWFAIPKKEKGPDMNDIIEEALCFNWIDSTMKVLNDDHTVLRMTPRKKKGGFSQLNIERISLLLAQDQVHPDFREALEAAAAAPFHFPQDILTAIKKNKEAWRYFQELPEAYKRIRIASIVLAREDVALFEKRLQKFIDYTSANKLLPGSTGNEKYY